MPSDAQGGETPSSTIDLWQISSGLYLAALVLVHVHNPGLFTSFVWILHLCCTGRTRLRPRRRPLGLPSRHWRAYRGFAHLVALSSQPTNTFPSNGVSRMIDHDKPNPKTSFHWKCTFTLL